MEVNGSYVKLLLQLLNSEKDIKIEQHKEELMVNLYLTLLSLSNLEFSDTIDNKEKEIISDFLRKLNNLKVKIQLKRKPEEINKLASELITQYYENINILSIYIDDGIQLENVINTMDSKSLTKLIDEVTKDKMNKEDQKDEINKKRSELIKILPASNYHINKGKIFIDNNNIHHEITITEFINVFSYLLIRDNYNKLYQNKANQRAHELVITDIIKLLIVKDKKAEEIDKVLIPLILTYIMSLNIDNSSDLDTSNFNIENIKITELYSLAKQEQPKETTKNTKWRNISIPNEYLVEKLKEMIAKGMYYYKENTFVLENIENKTSDFKVSISIDKIKEFLKEILEKKSIEV